MISITGYKAGKLWTELGTNEMRLPMERSTQESICDALRQKIHQIWPSLGLICSRQTKRRIQNSNTEKSSKRIEPLSLQIDSRSPRTGRVRAPPAFGESQTALHHVSSKPIPYLDACNSAFRKKPIKSLEYNFRTGPS